MLESMGYSGRAPLKRSRRPRGLKITRTALYNRVWSKPLSTVADELGITANGLAKICDRVLVPYPTRGHWAHAEPSVSRPLLPPAPAAVDETIVLSKERSPSRRVRTRLNPEARAEQLVDTASRIITGEGVYAASMKRVARDAGVSEAQAYNYFRRQQDLLIAIARRELDAMNALRLGEINKIKDPQTRITLSTVIYLREAERRGALIQTLLNNPDVRSALRSERNARRSSSVGEISGRLEASTGVPRDIGKGLTTILTALCLRAGRLLAAKRIPLEVAERLTLAIVLRANRDITRKARRR
jgi:AcrR family transcriptional regulator